MTAQINLRQLLFQGAESFIRGGLCFGHGTDNPEDEALLLALSALGFGWDDDIDLDMPLSPAQRQAIEALFTRRVAERIPAAYITGEAWFMGLRFEVDPRVLVPRSPIGEMIAAEFQPWLGATPARDILDLCCGSGCLGIACAYVFPDAQITIADISGDALEVARANIALHGLAGRVQAVQSDLLDALAGQQFDLIVCNPPYVDGEDLSSMPAEFAHEPELGLASGSDGLDHARRIFETVKDYLQPGGLLVLEVGNSWPALEAAYPQTPFLWVEFEFGGHGVLAIRREELP